MDAPCDPAEERQTCLFPIAPAHRPSFFSSLSPQEFVDVSNQMYIIINGVPFHNIKVIAFDKDGTLFDALSFWQHIDALRKQEFLKIVGRNHEHKWHALLLIIVYELKHVWKC
ncbi:hypothetical protein P9597_08780 [Aneurinibacillus migulanus]|uniref:hypothetical protein n=1 Tax=Aneurinibacillus migulanus TaxID=47500 RepID=UPI002E20FF10|nr:hypothetical protein [Aneurinibacillus migulanus]